MIKIQMELPSNWLEERQANELAEFLGGVRTKFENALFDKAVEQALKDLKIPKIKIDKKKLEDAVIREIARSKIEA